METKLSKVKAVQPSGGYTGQYGEMYQFIITMENNDCGTFTTKAENQTKFEIGKEVNYTIESKQGKNGSYFAIKPATTDGTKNEWGYRLESLQIAVQTTERGATLERIIEKAKEFEYYLNTGKIKGDNKQVQQNNNLPF
jgi:hypothetical protein